MGVDPNEIRAGLLRGASRTYGEQFMEPFLRHVYNLAEAEGGDYDAISQTYPSLKYEIKVAKALRPRLNEDSRSGSIVEQILAHALNDETVRAVGYADRYRLPYNANIQNVKRDHFDFLLYAVLFADRVLVFEAPVTAIKKPTMPGWSDHHGRYDAPGKSGQFNINKRSIAEQESKFLKDIFTYRDLTQVFMEMSEDG